MDISDRLEMLEKRLPNSGIIAPGFWRRAWTVFGYHWAIMLLIYAVMFAIFLVFPMFGALLGGL